ncbi:DUF3159 domain-containing protein [Lentzea sp. JNUCC 0626]|uniref:DUF3159 domain-containing protein n=1 Tax=Lentzea sp. JNUCC 0626 TaxID=3367513 RepID=UPI0037482DAD
MNQTRTPVAPQHAGFSEALRSAWKSSGGVAGILVTASPAIAFVAVSTISGLTAAIVAAAVTAALAFGYRIARGERLGGAIAGLVIAAVCALVAAVTGEARAFFLLPTLLPAVILLLCLASVIARRPVTGLVFNRIAGGPADWRHDRGLMRIYDVTTLIAVGINVVNFTLQALFYAADETVVLAVAHAATAPVFAALAAGTLFAARRRITNPKQEKTCES